MKECRLLGWSINLIEQGIQPKRTVCIKLSAQRRFCPAKKINLALILIGKSGKSAEDHDFKSLKTGNEAQ